MTITVSTAEKGQISFTHGLSLGIRVIPTGPEANDAEFSGGVNAAILRYKGAPNAEPNTTDTNANGIELVEANLSVSNAHSF